MEAHLEIALLLRRLETAERRGRLRSIIGAVVIALSLLIVATPRAMTAPPATHSIPSLDQKVKELEAKTRFMSVNGTTTLFTGTNVQVVSGSGKTDGPVNGLGNLIVGYNEQAAGLPRTGSHNLVVGELHSYTSFGGVVFGWNNFVSGWGASVLGGSGNEAKAYGAVVVGGEGNTASGSFTTVVGGKNKKALNPDSVAMSKARVTQE